MDGLGDDVLMRTDYRKCTLTTSDNYCPIDRYLLEATYGFLPKTTPLGTSCQPKTSDTVVLNCFWVWLTTLCPPDKHV